MSYNDRVINPELSRSINKSGYVIDFDNGTWTHMLSDSTKIVDFNFKTKTFQVLPDTTKFDYNIYKNDSIETELYINMISVFRPLNLNHKIHKSKQEIFNYLTKNNFENVKDSTYFKFSNSIYQFSNTKELRVLEGTHHRNKLRGYWYLGEIRNNYFIFLTMMGFLEQNIYQIISIDNKGVKLKKIQEGDSIWGITELKTCL